MKKITYPEFYFENKNRFWHDIDDVKWNDWEWHLSNSIQSLDCINKLFPDIIEIDKTIKKLKFRITPYFLSLINTSSNNDPLLKQVLPSRLELIDLSFLSLDPFNEKGKSPVNCLIKRYPDRAIITVTNKCPSYCRYCTRKWNWDNKIFLNKKIIKDIHDYLEKEKSIREIIISGGEPFMINEDILFNLLDGIINIDHIEAIRIGTRILTFLPQRITGYLAERLSKYKPLWIITHFNHSNEITPATEDAVDKLIGNGAVLSNQSVLLKNINDDLDTMKNLVHKLQILRIKPYYLFQCDLVKGTNHFRASIKDGCSIIEGLRGDTGGICIPTYVIDLPDGGKIPVNSDYILKSNSKEIIVKNYEGKIVKYPNTNPPYIKNI